MAEEKLEFLAHSSMIYDIVMEQLLTRPGDRPLKPSMVFSVDPGIYLPGKSVVRIENSFVCTKDGHYSINNLLRELKVID